MSRPSSAATMQAGLSVSRSVVRTSCARSLRASFRQRDEACGRYIVFVGLWRRRPCRRRPWADGILQVRRAAGHGLERRLLRTSPDALTQKSSTGSDSSSTSTPRALNPFKLRAALDRVAVARRCSRSTSDPLSCDRHSRPGWSGCRRSGRAEARDRQDGVFVGRGPRTSLP